MKDKCTCDYCGDTIEEPLMYYLSVYCDFKCLMDAEGGKKE